MKFIKDYKDGDRFFDIYLCKFKQSAVTKNGKPYENVILQDKTGTMDAKIWDPNSMGIDEFEEENYRFSIHYTQKTNLDKSNILRKLKNQLKRA